MEVKFIQRNSQNASCQEVTVRRLLRVLHFLVYRPNLPEYVLDFGYVVYGLVVSRTVTLSNIGHCPVSFTTAHKVLEGTGYSIDLGERIRALPSSECLDFTVRFDPATIKCTMGEVTAVLPFKVCKNCI